MPRSGHLRAMAVAALLTAGAGPIGLVLAGQPRHATVLWSVGERGARNRSWRIGYRYVVDGHAYRGMSRGSRALPAGVSLTIRTLPGLPRVASALSDGALLLWGVAAWIAAGLLWIGAALLARRRPASPRGHRSPGG